MKSVRRRSAPLVAVGACFLLLSACATDQGASSLPSDSSRSDYAAVDVAEAAEGSGAATVEQQLVTTGSSTIVVDDPADAVDSAREIADELGGQVSDTSTATYDGDPSADVTIRVPAERYDDLTARLGELGSVESSSTEVADVGQEVVDLRARQTALQGSIDRLTQLMAEATTTQDLLAAEEMMTQRQGELDSLTGQLSYLEDRVALSTQQVSFVTGGSSDNLWNDLVSTLADSSRSLLIVLVGLLPWLIVAGLLAWAATAMVKGARRVRRRRQQATGETAVD